MFLANHPLPPFYIALLISVPSLLLYIAEVGLLVWHRKPKFNPYFYHLFLVRACTNIVNYFNTYVYIRFGRLGWFMDVYQSMDPHNPILLGTWFLN